jgi:glycosyltransferase involved in cell wall biosynthesis
MKIFIPFYLYKQKNKNAVSDIFTYVIDYYDENFFHFSALGDFNELSHNKSIYNIRNKLFRVIKKINLFLKTDTIWTVQGDRFSFIFSKVFRKRLIVSFHADYKTMKQNCLENKIKSIGYCTFGIFKLLGNADIIIPSSKYAKESLAEDYNTNIKYVYNGVDFDFFTNRNKPKEEKFTICFIGRYVEGKRAEIVFKLANKLPNINFIMAGGDLQNSYLSTLKKPDNIKSIGWVDRNKIKELYHQSNLMIFPSISEGFGLVILEANACGLPVIASNIPVFSEIIQNDNGTLIDVDNNEIDSYINAIKKYQEFIPNTRKSILNRDEFLWKNVSQNYINIFKKLK